MEPRSPDEPVRLGVDDPDGALAAWLADATVDEAAAARARGHWLRRAAAEDATLVGVLVDLGERATPVTVCTRGGQSARGAVVAVGDDFVIVRQARLGDVIVPLSAVATVREASGEPGFPGRPTVAAARRMGDALVELAPERPEVLVTAGGRDLRGDLRSAGRDVVAVQLDNASREVVHVAVAAIDRLVVIAR